MKQSYLQYWTGLGNPSSQKTPLTKYILKNFKKKRKWNEKIDTATVEDDNERSLNVDVGIDGAVLCSRNENEADNDSSLSSWGLSSISNSEDSDVSLTSLTNNTDDNEEQSSELNKNMTSGIYSGCPISINASLHLVLGLQVKHQLTKSATMDILKLIKLHLPQSIPYPTSTFKFERRLQVNSSLVNREFYCDTCQFILDSNFVCKQCHVQKVEKDLVAQGHFFLVFDIIKQFECILGNPYVGKCIEKTFKLRDGARSVDYHDITSGELYKKAVIGKHDLSCTINSDGVPVFRSSKYSIWPVLFSVNELLYTVRKHTILLGALWFGKVKPNFRLFLPPVIRKMNEFQTIPVRWTGQNGLVYSSRIHFLMCTVDAPARCMIQGITQFNGKYGCNWCLHPGEQVKKGKGTCRVFPKIEPLPESRQSREFRLKIIRREFTQGLQYASPILLLEKFDIVNSFAVDYMHCVFLGVCRTFTGLWLNQKNETYYIGNNVTQIDKFNRTIKLPSELVRTIRSLGEIKYWKASEWRTWLFIIPVTLKQFLPDRYIRHFRRLSESVHILSKPRITEAQIAICDTMLEKFIRDIESLYGKQYVSFNVHQLQLHHLTTCVRNWGPLWGSSAFQFESYNGKLLSFIKSSQDVTDQISRKFLIGIEMEEMAGKVFQAGSEANSFFSENYRFKQKHSDKFGLISPHESKIFNTKVQSYLNEFVCSSIKSYYSKSAVIHHHKFSSKDSKKRTNRFVYIDVRTIGRIIYFIYAPCQAVTNCNCVNEFGVIETFTVRRFKKSSYISYCSKETPTELIIKPISQIELKKYIFIDTEQTSYFLEVPNLFEAD